MSTTDDLSTTEALIGRADVNDLEAILGAMPEPAKRR